MDTLALSLILAGKFLLRSLKYEVGFLFFVDVLYQVKEVPLYSYFGVFFNHEWVSDFVKFSSPFIDIIMHFFFFSLLIRLITLIDF